MVRRPVAVPAARDTSPSSMAGASRRLVSPSSVAATASVRMGDAIGDERAEFAFSVHWT